ncbi:MAG: hypothetical protein IPG90_15570 [Bacteroidetes bacterium]|nr:hypothetical protein [Bacteroidota bacterium]
MVELFVSTAHGDVIKKSCISFVCRNRTTPLDAVPPLRMETKLNQIGLKNLLPDSQNKIASS